MFTAFLWSGLCAGVLAAPWLASQGRSDAAALLYALFSPVCHQDPARSFAVFHFPLAVCHRCCGIYTGLLLASLLPLDFRAFFHDPGKRRRLVGAAAAPLLLDVVLPHTGLWTNTQSSRFLTGLIFGAMAGVLLAMAGADIFRDVRMRRNHLNVDALGGAQ